MTPLILPVLHTADSDKCNRRTVRNADRQVPVSYTHLLDENSDYVVLMTLHSAKGLEFPRVYLAGMEDGLFPSYMTVTADDPDELEEERRLCYVGITRAQNELTMTCARKRMVRGETQYNKMSRFLKEVPLELIRCV